MRRLTLLLSLLALAPATADAAPLQVKPDKQNVVASRLVGSWEPDRELCKRMGVDDPGHTLFEFKSDPKVAGTIPAKYEPFLKDKHIYMAGKLVLTRGKAKDTMPFVLVTHRGNPHVVFFRPRGGDPMGDAESFNVMLGRGKTPAQDVLLVGGDFNNQPLYPYRRAKEAGKVQVTDPQSVVLAWVEAVKKGDMDAALALGTKQWVERETTWKRSFTNALTKGGWKLKWAQLRPATIEGDEARVSAKAMFINEKGNDDPEGLRFRLKRIAGAWKIVELN